MTMGQSHQEPLGDLENFNSCSYCGFVPALTKYELDGPLTYRSGDNDNCAVVPIWLTCETCEDLLNKGQTQALVARMEEEWCGASRERRQDATTAFHRARPVRSRL